MRLSLSEITGLNKQFVFIQEIYKIDKVEWFCTPDLYRYGDKVIHVTMMYGDQVIRISRPFMSINSSYVGVQIMEVLDLYQIPKNSFKLYAKQLTDDFSSL
jgi:hypothetical protein